MNEYLNKSNQNLVDYQSCPAVRRTAYLNFCSCCIFNNTLIHNFNVSFANGLSACENVLVQRVLQFNLYCALCHSCHFSLFFVFCMVDFLLFCLCVCFLCMDLVVWFKINGMNGMEYLKVIALTTSIPEFKSGGVDPKLRISLGGWKVPLNFCGRVSY